MPPLDRQALVVTLAASLAPRPEILEAYLFGSHARGDAQPHSDIDVAVYVDRDRAPDPAFGYLAELTADLMRALQHDAVDVVVLNRASPLLYHRVLRDGIRVVSRDLAATTVREVAPSRATATSSRTCARWTPPAPSGSRRGPSADEPRPPGRRDHPPPSRGAR